jgi:hypothetical protein
MRPYHGLASAAMAGWYLLVRLTLNKVGTLSEWTRIVAFDKADDCEEIRHHARP